MESLLVLGKSFVLAFSALLPVLDPLGSALVFLALVGQVPEPLYRNLSRKVAVDTAVFLVAFELGGAATLSFFGISLPVMELSGGLVLASMGWQQLNRVDSDADRDQAKLAEASFGGLKRKAFYPLTFPVTADPGCIVVILTLSAHSASRKTLGGFMAHLGISLAVIALSALVFLSYAYAPKITQRISPETKNGVQRVIAFVLLCIGVQIAWNGLGPLMHAALQP